MKSLWDDETAAKLGKNDLNLRVYSSRLLGRETRLVLHGGGNTSVKTQVSNVFGEMEEILFIKGSGRDLATIKARDFAPVRLEVPRRLAALDQLGDTEMLRLLRSALTDYRAPNPSLETVLHALIPFKFVDHTHADDVVTITNNRRGAELIRAIYGERVLIVPYVNAGFKLAKSVYALTRGVDWQALDGLILLNHGVFTFGDDAHISYEKMIRIADRAEDYLRRQGAAATVATVRPRQDPAELALIRRRVCLARGAAMIARLDQSPEACGFADLADLETMAGLGPITADHILHTKAVPLVLRDSPQETVDDFVAAYRQYFAAYTDGTQSMHDPAPRWAIWPRHGTIAFGRSLGEAEIVADIVRHTVRAIQLGEAIGGWQPLSPKHIFEMEYWPLQQAKLATRPRGPELQGKIALVTGAASGIGLACAKALRQQGAVVVGLDLSPECALRFGDDKQCLGVTGDIADETTVRQTVEMTVNRFGGVDIVVSCAGIFAAGQKIEALDPATWQRSLEINLSAHQRLLKICIPYLKQGLEPAVVLVASKNVPAPGPGAAAYSVAKAGLTQLARVAALELGGNGIRVNVIHPDAVYDTGLWTPEVLENRARHYGLTVAEYRTKNILKTEVASKDVAALVCAMVGRAFAKTTGAQVPIDGGNERVI